MSGSRMHAETFALLRHIEVHGPRTRVELSKGLQQADKDVVKRLANLTMLGYLALDDTTRPANFTLTGKARLKLADRNAVYSPAPPAQPKPIPKKPLASETPAMSAAEAARPIRRAVLLMTRRRQRVDSRAPMGAPYSATEYTPCLRPGANDALALPSRFGDRLHYRDGRVTDLDGNPLP